MAVPWCRRAPTLAVALRRSYLRTLRLATLTRAVTNELAGTYAAELMRTWEDEAELALTWLEENICKKHSREICQRDPSRAGSLPFSREDMKWSLGVVRSYAFWVTKRTTRRRFLALFPYSALVHHRQGAGGNCTLELDNSIRLYAGADHAPGSRLEFDRGELTDAETLLTYARLGDPDAHRPAPPSNCAGGSACCS